MGKSKKMGNGADDVYDGGHYIYVVIVLGDKAETGGWLIDLGGKRKAKIEISLHKM